MTTPLRLLQLEDNTVDAELILATLNEGGIPCETSRVDRRDTFVDALKAGKIDLILADYSLPGFDGITALSLAQQLRPDIPFIFVSGTLGEELAIDAMHRGATDYILKQRLGRLVPSLQRAIRELQERQERARVEEALRQSEKQLRQAQKMEAVGRLAGGLAHDFNNLLTVIMGHAQVLLNEMETEHPFRAKVEEMQKAGDRAATLIRQLLTFSRKQPSTPKVLSVNPLITNFETMMRRLIGEDLELTLALAPQDLRISADPAQIEQVLMNLVVNARDAMPKGGRLRIETAQVELTKMPMYHVQLPALGTFVKISVSDTGTGMSADTLTHIFEPFFTTKEEGKGTGLGLSTVFGIVTQSGGGLDVTSRIGQGSRFDVYFPSVRSNLDPTASDQTPRSSNRGGETILLVEDDASVRDLVRDELKKLGYRVLESKNGLEACLVATQQIGNYQLLLTDVVMPGMNGTELAQHLRILKPDLRILFISGYADDVGIGATDQLSDYLQKPFTPEALSQRIRQLLDLTPLPQNGSPRKEASTSHAS
ncbi:MAG: response regulator [Nitrospiraceae bacterium]|nr:response regulator [Nitrospiraceae bacterium]